jgi:transposase
MMVNEVRLGIDVACTATHQASLADESGRFLWQGWRFRTVTADLETLWDKIPDGTRVVVVMEPTRNAWVPLAGWLQAKGAEVSVVPPEQSADLRDYYNKHTKTDRLDSKILARIPMLHPEGLRQIDSLGPADALKRAVRHRSSIQKRRTSAAMRIDALVELLGPDWAGLFGTVSYGKAVVAVLERYANPHALKKLGRSRLSKLLIRASRGHWREDKADEILAVADETLALWAAGGLDFDELADDIAIEIRLVKSFDAEIAVLDDRIEALYEHADPFGIVESVPGIGVVLAAGILGRSGDFNRFHSLAGVRAFTGLVPKIDQSGSEDKNKGLTKSGDPGLRQALFLAADLARKVDPTLAARYHRLYMDAGKHHNSAVCTLAAALVTRIAACWRNGQRYELRDTNGRIITETEGRAICATRYKIDPATRAARRNKTTPRKLKGTGQDKKESQSAPVANPPTPKSTQATKTT